jgi:uncharacterized membrane protein YeaQ/YmgE (transglycosylase-associated protein family)
VAVVADQPRRRERGINSSTGPRCGDEHLHVPLRRIVFREFARVLSLADAKGGEITVSNIIWIIMIGFITGIIARVLSPGPNELAGFILTTALGIAGAFVATFIGQTIGWYRLDQGAGLIGATVGAVLVLFVWNRFFATRAPAAGDIRGPGPSPRRWL